MSKIKRFLFTGTFVTLLLVACQPLLIPLMPTGEGTEQSATVTALPLLTDTTTVAGTIPVAETGAMSSTEAVSTTADSGATVVISATATAIVPATDTPIPTASTEQSAASAEPILKVLVASLRIRSGPSTAYAVVGAATQGEQYPIVGQAYACQWYQVTHPQFGEVWLSGDAQYVATGASCDQIAEAALPTPAPTATPAPVQGQQAGQPAPTESPAQPVDDPFPADQGCLLLQNQLGPELTFTFTSADGSWRDIIKVSADHDVPYCFKPGRYRVTVDAPPPWSSLNRDFEIKAGDRAYFPIRPQ